MKQPTCSWHLEGHPPCGKPAHVVMVLVVEDPALARSAKLTGAMSTVTDATSEYRADQDVLQHFVDARCTTGAGQRVKGSALYASYKQWAEIAGSSS